MFDQSATIVVTGASGILGRATCKLLSDSGAKVVAVDYVSAADPIEGAAITYLGVDLSDSVQSTELAKTLEADFGSITGLVMIAGGFVWEPLLEGPIETWDRMWSLNLKTALVTVKAFEQLLENNMGSIVAVGAQGALKAGMGMGAYAASKSAVARLVEALSEELKDRRIRVNSVMPSIIDTPTNRKDMPDADTSEWATPDEVAHAIQFLCSSSASGINGAHLPVSGRM